MAPHEYRPLWDYLGDHSTQWTSELEKFGGHRAFVSRKFVVIRPARLHTVSYNNFRDVKLSMGATASFIDALLGFLFCKQIHFQADANLCTNLE